MTTQLTDTLSTSRPEGPPAIIRFADRKGYAVEDLQARLDDQGVLILREAISEESLRAARDSLRKAYLQDVYPQLGGLDNCPSRDTPLGVLVKDHWPSGIVGNKGFGFLFAQPESVDEVPYAELGDGLRLAMGMCSTYRVNIELMSHPSNQEALDLLFAVTGNEGGMITQDSVKMHRGDLTTFHMDKYADPKGHNRVQAMAIGLAEGDIRLYFGLGTHRRHIQEAMGLKVDRRGFVALPKGEPQKAVIRALADANLLVCGGPRDLVIWRSGVLHGELNRDLIQRNNRRTTTERYVVGTHTPKGFTRYQLMKLAHLAEAGFIMHPYGKLNQTNVGGANTFCSKTTQYKRKRKRTLHEKIRFDVAVATVTHLEDMPALKRRCYGI